MYKIPSSYEKSCSILVLQAACEILSLVLYLISHCYHLALGLNLYNNVWYDECNKKFNMLFSFDYLADAHSSLTQIVAIVWE